MQPNRFYPHSIIAKEGWCLISAVLFGTLCVFLFSSNRLWQGFAACISLFIIYLFRDVARNIPQETNTILCPSDGRILLLEKTLDPLHHTEALKISINTKTTRAYAIRAPISGTLVHCSHTQGKHYRSKRDKAGSLNTRNTLHIIAPNQIACTMVQATGKIARTAHCYAEANTQLVRGERIGFTPFGGRVDIYLSAHAIPNVAIGDRVKASSTILARISQEKHHDNATS